MNFDTRVIESFDWKLYREFALAVAAFCSVFLVLIFVKSYFYRKLSAWVKSTSNPHDDVLIEFFKRPAYLLIFLFSLSTALQFLPKEYQDSKFLLGFFKLSIIFLVFWILFKVIGYFLLDRWLSQKLMASSLKMMRNVLRFLLLSIGLLIALDNLGVSITPLLASLGVGSIAIALALQGVLGNLFSGFFIMLDRPMKAGDYVRIAGNIEGVVQKIGWRSTSLLTISGHTSVFPNAKVADSEILNFNVNDGCFPVTLSFNLSPECCELNEIEERVLRLSNEVLDKVSQGRRHSGSSVNFVGFFDPRIQLEVKFRVSYTGYHKELIHEFIKSLQREFKKEKIQLKFNA